MNKIYTIKSKETYRNETNGFDVPVETFSGSISLIAQDADAVYLATGNVYKDGVPVVQRYGKENYNFFDIDGNEIEFEIW